MIPSVKKPDDLIADVRERADKLERYAPEVANAFRDLADEFEASMHAYATEPLELARGAEESGYNIDSLGRLLRDQPELNVGEPGAPRIRRCDLPKKARRTVTTEAGALSLDRLRREAVAGRVRRRA